jgi:hypothetical protein
VSNLRKCLKVDNSHLVWNASGGYMARGMAVFDTNLAVARTRAAVAPAFPA